MELSPQAFEELIDQAVDMLTVLDESGVIKYQNPATGRMVGYRSAELVGDDAFGYIHPDDRQKALDTFSEVVNSTAGYTTESVEFRFQHRDGSWVWLESRASNQIATETGGYVIASRDITDRKRYERELQQERDRLERFTAFVSHDLRNPLNVAQGYLELSQRESDPEHLHKVARSLDRMDELISDMLLLTREGGVQPLLDTVELERIAEECWRNVDTKAAALEIDTADRVRADEGQLRSLLENLVRNAVEHGGEDVTLTIGTLDDGFYVEDDGRGIPEDEHETLLEYGFTTTDDGTGLGLNIVDEVTRNHGWDMTIVEGAAGGARFEISDVVLAG